MFVRLLRAEIACLLCVRFLSAGRLSSACFACFRLILLNLSAFFVCLMHFFAEKFGGSGKSRYLCTRFSGLPRVKGRG